MKVSKAIKVLQIINATAPPWVTQDSEDALKLGIEALKQVKHMRGSPLGSFYTLLPGETPEEATKDGQD